MSKPWAHMREHGPCMIFGWYATREEAEAMITAAFHAVAYFPHRDIGMLRKEGSAA